MSLLKSFLMSQTNNILYATNKGNLTDNNNVFSGFSTSKYLLMQNPFDYTKNITFNIRFTTSNNITNEQVVFWSDKGFGGIINNNNFYLHIRDNLGNDSFVANFTLNTNTEYELKIVKTNNNISWYFGTPNNLIQQTNINNRDFSNILTYQMIIGYAIGTNYYFLGSIDINYTNIKINSISYEIQVVVGYTIVGSLTESPSGVFSGFSSGNYVHILNFPNTFNSLEIITKVKKSATGNQAIFALHNGSTAQKKFYLYMANSACIFYYRSANDETKNISISYSVNVDVYYYFRLKISNSKIKLGYSTDGTNWVEKEIADTMAIASGMELRFGIVSNNNWYLNGAIDMNETLIKKDKKLWFNGQEG